MLNILIIFLIVMFVLFLIWFIRVFSSFGGVSPSARRHHYASVVKPEMKHKAAITKAMTKEAHKDGIMGHWHKRIKKAGENSAKGKHLIKLRNTELAIHERQYSSEHKHSPHQPKIHGSTGHTTGGVGRAGHKHSHHMPKPKKVKAPKSSKIPKGARRSLRDKIVGDSGNWRGKK